MKWNMFERWMPWIESVFTKLEFTGVPQWVEFSPQDCNDIEMPDCENGKLHGIQKDWWGICLGVNFSFVVNTLGSMTALILLFPALSPCISIPDPILQMLTPRCSTNMRSSSEAWHQKMSIPGDQFWLKNVDRVFKGCCTVNTKRVWYLHWGCTVLSSSDSRFYQLREAKSMMVQHAPAFFTNLSSKESNISSWCCFPTKSTADTLFNTDLLLIQLLLY